MTDTIDLISRPAAAIAIFGLLPGETVNQRWMKRLDTLVIQGELSPPTVIPYGQRNNLYYSRAEVAALSGRKD